MDKVSLPHCDTAQAQVYFCGGPWEDPALLTLMPVWTRDLPDLLRMGAIVRFQLNFPKAELSPLVDNPSHVLLILTDKGTLQHGRW
jgi:hypothetical protein